MGGIYYKIGVGCVSVLNVILASGLFFFLSSAWFVTGSNCFFAVMLQSGKPRQT